MNKNYIKGKGIFIGTFDLEDVTSGKDKEIVNKFLKENNMQYVNTTCVKKNKKIIGLKVWACTLEDMEL